ncbi:MAG: uroporphyrinogen decarboxylase family protein [Pirellulales bacterium]|nr:uroporphyrinogen decarboxylase family protein [Pirellulales bacterium]
MNGRERILAVLEDRPVDCLPQMPITMMFAGDQGGVPYGKYAADHRLLVDCQIHVAEKFDLDYVSCISDPTREAADCGAAIKFFDNQPPAVEETRALLADKKTLAGLKIPDPLGGGRMHDRVRAAALFRERVGGEKLIEGWIEGPCAEAADLRGINTLMLDFFDDPAFVRDLFDFVLQMELQFARAQIEAGVDIMGVGDAAASLLGPQIYEEFVLPYEKKMIDALHEMGTKVRMHICGNISRILSGVGQLGCEMVDIDWMVPLTRAREEMGPGQVLAGNIDPVAVLRNGTPESITAAIAECHRQCGRRFIVGAGCEVPRGTPEENLLALRDYARSHAP